MLFVLSLFLSHGTILWVPSSFTAISPYINCIISRSMIYTVIQPSRLTRAVWWSVRPWSTSHAEVVGSSRHFTRLFSSSDHFLAGNWVAISTISYIYWPLQSVNSSEQKLQLAHRLVGSLSDWINIELNYAYYRNTYHFHSPSWLSPYLSNCCPPSENVIFSFV